MQTPDAAPVGTRSADLDLHHPVDHGRPRWRPRAPGSCSLTPTVRSPDSAGLFRTLRCRFTRRVRRGEPRWRWRSRGASFRRRSFGGKRRAQERPRRRAGCWRRRWFWGDAAARRRRRAAGWTDRRCGEEDQKTVRWTVFPTNGRIATLRRGWRASSTALCPVGRPCSTLRRCARLRRSLRRDRTPLQGIVRWRRRDLCTVMERRFGVRVAERTMGAILLHDAPNRSDMIVDVVAERSGMTRLRFTLRRPTTPRPAC